MFALALGIDYALFVVHRFRGAYFGSRLPAREAVAVTMDAAGKAVLFSSLTVLISLSAVMLVQARLQLDGARDHAQRRLHLLAALTLLPPCSPNSARWTRFHGFPGCTPASTARPRRWGERLWRRPYLYGAAATLVLVLLAYRAG